MSTPAESNEETRRIGFGKLTIPKVSLFGFVTEIFSIAKGASVTVILLILTILLAATFFFIHSAPPTSITITTGPEGSHNYKWAQDYARFLQTQGIKVHLLTSQGSVENLQRLADPSFPVDVGFVQDLPLEKDKIPANLISLGSVGHQPLWVFYRGAVLNSLVQMKGKRLAIGRQGSGTRTLTLFLLKANGIDPSAPSSTSPAPPPRTTFLDLPANESFQALLDRKVDVIFLMGEDASSAMILQLLGDPDIKLFNFVQAEAYTRKYSWLSWLNIPEGAFDFGKDIPSQYINLIGPTVEIIARKTLHHALSDVILEAATEVNGKASIIQRQGEFPAPIVHDIPISSDATRFYTSGKTYFYRYLPFWLASLASRFVVVVVPSLLFLFPIIRAIPAVYRWRVQSQIVKWYRALLALERQLIHQNEPQDRRQLLAQLDEIEKSVNKMKIPSFSVEQFYVLRGHIDFVRHLISPSAPKTENL